MITFCDASPNHFLWLHQILYCFQAVRCLLHSKMVIFTISLSQFNPHNTAGTCNYLLAFIKKGNKKKRRNQLREAVKQILYLTSSILDGEVNTQGKTQYELCQITFYIWLPGCSEGGIPIPRIATHHLTATFMIIKV